MSSRKLSFIDTFRGEDMTKRIAQNATTDALTQHLSEAIDHSQMMREDANRATTVTTITQMIGLGIIWTAGGFSDSACFVLQAAFFRSRKSLSTSFGVRYPRAE